MKKAKIMLIAIGVVAVVGGALAFKAKTTSMLPHICYTKQVPLYGFCAFATNATITTPAQKQFDAFYSTEMVPLGANPDTFCTTINCDFGPKPFKVNL